MSAIMNRLFPQHAGVAQLVEQLICNQQVGGSNPSTSSTIKNFIVRDMGVFPSGQRGQTVNLLAYAYGGSNPPAPTIKTALESYFLKRFLL